VLVDANILLYAVDSQSSLHDRTRSWLEGALNGPRRVGIPWQSLSAFVRIATNPRALADPLSPAEAFSHVDAWLDAPTVWTPEPGPGHREIFRDLLVEHDLHANLVSDAALAALCVEHGLTMVSADSDFARFDEISWLNPT